MKLRSVQVLRAVAACAVVVHHAFSVITPDSATRIGAAGVDLFFVISGFIMATVAVNKTPTEFLSDRARRILPMWWIALTPWVIARQPSLAKTLSSISLWPIYGGQFHTPVLSVGWTLCFEMLFYAAFAIAIATRWWIPLLAFGLFLISSTPDRALLSYLGSPMIVEFLFGVLIARLPRIDPLGLSAIVVGLCAFALSPTDFYDQAMGLHAWSRLFHWGVPAALIVYGAVTLEHYFAHRLYNVPVYLGNASYSIYLFHRLGCLSSSWIANLLLSLAIGVAAYRLIEQPGLALLSQWRQTMRLPAQPLVPRLATRAGSPPSLVDAPKSKRRLARARSRVAQRARRQ